MVFDANFPFFEDNFSLRFIFFTRYFSNEDFSGSILSKQLLKSGTSIGANVSEAQKAQSKADFHTKMTIALKEANETYYWLRLLYKTDFLTSKEFSSIETDIKEIVAILTSVCRKTDYK